MEKKSCFFCNEPEHSSIDEEDSRRASDRFQKFKKNLKKVENSIFV